MSPQKMKKVCVLTSGGIDSSVLLHEMIGYSEKVFPVYIRSGLLWEETELYWLRRYLKKIAHASIQKLTVLTFPLQDTYGTHWSFTGEKIPGYTSEDSAVYLPGRNILLLAKAGVYCALNTIETIALGPLKGNPFPDSSPRFFRAMERSLSLGLCQTFSITTPFADLSKREVIQRGQGLPLELTFSCLSPQGRAHCGECNKCAERIRGLKEAGIMDRTIYTKKVTRIDHATTEY